MIYIVRTVSEKNAFARVAGLRETQIKKIENWVLQSKQLRSDDIHLRSPVDSPAFRELLYEAFDQKCAYCERKFSKLEESDLSLLRPARNATQTIGDLSNRSRTSELHYFWLAWEWSNMYLACRHCIGAKRANFPVAHRRAEPGLFGVKKLAEIEGPYLLDPCFENPLLDLEFLADGSVQPKAGSLRGLTTINIFDLNHQDLRKERATEAEKLLTYLNQGPTDVLARQILEQCADNQPFAGMKRQLVYRWLSESVTGDPTNNRKMSPSDEPAWRELYATVTHWCTAQIEPLLDREPPFQVTKDGHLGSVNPNQAGLDPRSNGESHIPTMSASPPSLHQSILNPGKSWAVLVGINQYEDASIGALRLCVQDVTSVHQNLTQNYSAVRLLTDITMNRLPTRKHIFEALALIARQAREDDLFLFYFSGHGIVEGRESYLLPRDASIAALKFTSISMREVREIMDSSAARAKVIILDACHSGVAISKAPALMTAEFMQHVYAEAKGMAVLSSCTQGEKAHEWPTFQHGVFTHFFLRAIKGEASFTNNDFVTITDVHRYVTDKIRQWSLESGYTQTPTLHCDVVGDIILHQYKQLGNIIISGDL